CRIGSDTEARHAQYARQEKRVVIDSGQRAPEIHRAADADAEHQQVAERVDDVPEDEQPVGGADLRLAHHHGAQCLDHDRSTRCVGSTKTSSRLAPFTSTPSTRPRRASISVSSRTRAPSTFTRICTVRPLIASASGAYGATSVSMSPGTVSKVSATS